VVSHGLALAAHFGDGRMGAADVAAGLIGAVIKDPVQDKVVWGEYLETIAKERDGWRDLYRACRDAERVGGARLMKGNSTTATSAVTESHTFRIEPGPTYVRIAFAVGLLFALLSGPVFRFAGVCRRAIDPYRCCMIGTVARDRPPANRKTGPESKAKRQTTANAMRTYVGPVQFERMRFRHGACRCR